MKKLLLILLLAILIISCDDNTVDPPIEGNPETSTFKSHNIKTNGKQYFTFSTNTASTTDNGNWDVAFGSVPLTVETSPCEYFTMPAKCYLDFRNLN